MKHEDFNMKEHGFVGHLAEPDSGSDKAVLIIMGGEQSLLPGIKFADYGITGLSVSLFGAEGLPDAPNQCPLEMFLPAVKYLREKKQIEHVIVGGLISLIGTIGVLGIDMITFAISALLISTIKDNEIVPKDKIHLQGILIGFREGMLFFKGQKAIQLVCLIGLFINFGIMPLSVFQTPYVSDYLSMGPEMLSLIKILMTLGMSAGAFIVPKLHAVGNARLAGTAGIVMGITLILMCIAPVTENTNLKLSLIVVAMFLIGAGGGVLNVIIGGCMMKNIPSEMMGRISGFIAATMQVSMPIASFLCSALAFWFEITQIFMVFGVLTVMIYTCMSCTNVLKRLNG